LHKFAWLDFVEAFIDITDAFLSQFKLKLRFKEEGGANQSRTYAAGYGTYKRDGKWYADFLGGRLQVWGRVVTASGIGSKCLRIGTASKTPKFRFQAT
jgi:hypothetical protein